MFFSEVQSGKENKQTKKQGKDSGRIIFFREYIPAEGKDLFIIFILK